MAGRKWETQVYGHDSESAGIMPDLSWRVPGFTGRLLSKVQEFWTLPSALVLYKCITWMYAAGTADPVGPAAISGMRCFRLWKSAGHMVKSGETCG